MSKKQITFSPYPEEPAADYEAARTDWDGRLKAVRDIPGAWFVVGEWNNRTSAFSTVAEVRAMFPEYEFKARREPGAGVRRSKLYARLPVEGDDTDQGEDREAK